jgi:hypothetical protein
MQRFLYCRDPLFLIGCAGYALNRWMLKPHLSSRFLHGYFNDLWLIPCALPPILWLHRRLRLRADDSNPHLSEIALHFVFWSVLFEYIGPKFMPHTVGDPLDVLAYFAGAVVAAIWWRSREAAARVVAA